jgi:hypothetical protein
MHYSHSPQPPESSAHPGLELQSGEYMHPHDSFDYHPQVHVEAPYQQAGFSYSDLPPLPPNFNDSHYLYLPTTEAHATLPLVLASKGEHLDQETPMSAEDQNILHEVHNAIVGASDPDLFLQKHGHLRSSFPTLGADDGRIVIPSGRFPKRRFSDSIRRFADDVVQRIPSEVTDQTLATKKVLIMSSLSRKQRITIEKGNEADVEKLKRLFIERVSRSAARFGSRSSLH